MLTRLPHLTVLSPSPTTTAFTVSTSVSPRSLSSHLLHHLLLLSRVLLGLVTIVILHAKAPYTSAQVALFSTSNYITPIPWTVLAPSALVSLLLVFRRFHSGTFIFGSEISNVSSASRASQSLNAKYLESRGVTSDIAHARDSNPFAIAVVSASSHHTLHPHVADS